VRRNGLALFGAEPAEIIPDVSVDELRDEATAQVRGFIARLPADATTGYLAYVALLACRAVHAIERGHQASKAGAARWLAARYPEWSELALRAVRVNDAIDQPPDAIHREEIERLLAWCVDGRTM
jgi:hypothetical protein